MATFLVKILAVLLTLSQVTTAPEAIKTQFDRTRDQEQVAGLLRRGCMHMRKVFDIEGINLDDLISTAFDDPQAIAHENLLFRGINFRDFQAAYRQFCSDKEIGGRILGDGKRQRTRAFAELQSHYLFDGAAVLDLFSRRVVSWAMSASMTAQLVADGL